MKSFLVCSALVMLAVAASGASIEALRSLPAQYYEKKVDELGQYALRYETVEGIIVEESGRLVPNDDGTDYVLIKEGSFTFLVDGVPHRISWTADTTGFHADGDDIPKAPEAVAA